MSVEGLRGVRLDSPTRTMTPTQRFRAPTPPGGPKTAQPPTQTEGDGAPGNAPSAASDVAAAHDAELELVWHHNRPRLLRRLQLTAATPQPDFDCARSRARSTAQRLNLPMLAESSWSVCSKRSSGDSAAPATANRVPPPRPTPPQAHKQISKPPTTHARPSWLSDDQMDFLSMLASRRQEIKGSLGRGRDEARATISGLASSWNQASKPAGGGSLALLRKGVPDVPIEGVLLQKLDAKARMKIATPDVGANAARRPVSLANSW